MIEGKFLCRYCLGCQQEELEDFKPKIRCNGFVPAEKDWQEKYYRNLKENK